MRKEFNVFDAFTVLVVYLLIENRVSWWIVLLPYSVELVIYAIIILSTYYGWTDRLKFFVWKKQVDRSVNKAVDRAKGSLT